MFGSDDLKTILTRDRVRACLVYACAPALAFFAVSVVILSLSGFTLVEILRDPAQITKQSSFLGFVSTIGTWLWVAAASICFFRIATYDAPAKDRYRRLLVLCAWFSLWLGFDDFFLIHDRYVTEGILFPLYAIFVITLLVRHRAMILRIDGFAFVMAGGMLAMSVMVDAVQEILPMPYGYSQLLEEGFKFIGAAAWLYFCVRLAAVRAEALEPGWETRPS